MAIRAKTLWVLPVMLLIAAVYLFQYTASGEGEGALDTGGDEEGTVFLIGDSTVASYPANKAPLTGWGQVIGSFLKEGVAVENDAVSGASSKSFVDAGYWATTLGKMQSGDYLFIQFGHNDQKSDPTWHTDPFTTYKAYLGQYITEARAKGVFPVLVTSAERRRFNSEGTITPSHKQYPTAMKQLGDEMDVPVIDLAAQSAALYEAWGVEGSKQLFLFLEPGDSPNYPDGKEDNTHFQTTGALELAGLVAQSVKDQDITPLRSLLKCP
jgi:lysophospholipase L1-like esterase